MLTKSDFEKFLTFASNWHLPHCAIVEKVLSWGDLRQDPYEAWKENATHEDLVELKCMIDQQNGYKLDFDENRSGKNGYFDRVFVKKGWGREEWIWNGSYCGKVLTVLKHRCCSWHFHVLKDETFYIKSGQIQLFVGATDDISQAETLILNLGDSYHVSRGLRHRFFGLQDSEIVEFSTTHYDSDSIRVAQGD